MPFYRNARDTVLGLLKYLDRFRTLTLGVPNSDRGVEASWIGQPYLAVYASIASP